MPHTLTRDNRGRFVRRYFCDLCQMLAINGLPCHESGCPDTWMDGTRECKECETEFTPKKATQHFCAKDCAHTYYNDFMLECAVVEDE